MIATLKRALRRHAAAQVDAPRRFPQEFAETPTTDDFVTGNGIAAHCRHVLNYGGAVEVNEHVDNDWWFCKADYLEYFFREVAPQDELVLFSHNSDRAIGRRFLRELRRPRLVAWFAQNPAVEHPKLRALPIGIANPKWPHGDQAVLRRVQAEMRPKRRLFDASFDVSTNRGERAAAVAATGLQPGPRRPFPDYLASLAEASFCISPAGNGIDGHRTWEALYVRTIPIVTASLVAAHHRDLPLVVLESWADFRAAEFGPERYVEVWGDWDPAELRLDRYLRRVEALIAARR